MSAAMEHLRPSPAQARILADLNRRVDALEKKQKALDEANAELRLRCGDLIDQRDMARQTAVEQQDEFEQWRLRPTPRPARPAIRDIPTGDAL